MNKSRSIILRLFLALLSIVFLLGPSAGFFYIAYIAYIEDGVFAIIIPAVLGLIFFGGGIAGIISNVKK